ncbi:Mu transposase C-terminal domain-containing protein [Cytobacillus oceanisediminis]|uniref:Transposase n=1 Tax=Cytobacillus oceanisediminis 2691 TaxID=1196031 RepID=A0A161JFX1_9BACI|nr:Mu transposase C-terminal domain-containing protein [Cytobacillus oceanisediminis]AND41445.1 transposase [Cytobacillus oceanisediminis 2691]
MGKSYIGVNTKFLLDGRRMEIIQEEEKDVFLVKDLEFGITERFELMDILHHLNIGNIVFTNSLTGDSEPPGYCDFSMLDEHIKARAMFKLEAIKPLLKLNVKVLTPYVQSRVETLKKKGQNVSRASLFRWLKSFRDSDFDILGLVDNTEKCGPREKKVDKEVEMIIERIISNYYYAREEISSKTIYELVYHEIDKVNETRIAGEQLLHPSESTVRRRIKALPIYDVEKEKKGINAVRNKYKNVNYHEKPTYPLQRVECDHTKLDLIVVDDENYLPIGRPTITSILDVYTGYPLGIYIGFEEPSYTAVSHALLHAITPKTYVKDKYPEIVHSWLAYGIPELLVVDNGKEFKSKHFKEACLQLGIDIYHCPVKMPWYKGAIERHFRTINQHFLHSAPGTTFSNVFKKGDYDPKKNGVIRFNNFLEYFHLWLIDYYAMSKNTGVNGIPSNLWKSYYEHSPRPAVPDKMIDWKIALMKVGYGSIQRRGIRRSHLFYKSDELFELKKEIEVKDKPCKVKYKYDPTDLSKIYVFNVNSLKYLEVPCTDQKYTQGLNEYAHRVIVKNTNKERGIPDKKHLSATKAKLIEKIKKEKESTMQERKRMKRIEGTGTDRILSTEPLKPSIKEIEVLEEKVEVNDELDFIDFDDWEEF